MAEQQKYKMLWSPTGERVRMELPDWYEEVDFDCAILWMGAKGKENVRYVKIGPVSTKTLLAYDDEEFHLLEICRQAVLEWNVPLLNDVTDGKGKVIYPKGSVPPVPSQIENDQIRRDVIYSLNARVVARIGEGARFLLAP